MVMTDQYRRGKQGISVSVASHLRQDLDEQPSCMYMTLLRSTSWRTVYACNLALVFNSMFGKFMLSKVLKVPRNH